MQEARDKAAAQGVALHDLAGADWTRIAALVLAPGIPLTHPEPHWSVTAARAAGVEVIGDTELFFRERARQGSGAKVVVITGTNGKSTTTALTAHLLKQAGKRVALGGNIGKAVLDLPPFAPDLTYVLEFSSFQIDLTPSLAADAAALLNVTPDHLDRHGTLENYAAIKARVFDGLESNGTAVIGVDDAASRAIADRLPRPFAVKRIAVGRKVETGVWAKDGILHEAENGTELAETSLAGIQSLRGAHNWQNAAAAYALARSQGIDAATIAKFMRSFAGLAHRMEQVGRLGRVLFVNDSKATNADATGKALASFDTI
jgi:UDP-N-acetylmuramoylalanine--D-glutamate ligase